QEGPIAALNGTERRVYQEKASAFPPHREHPMTSARTLPALAYRRLRTSPWLPDGQPDGLDGAGGNGVSHLARALREANDCAWTTLELMLACQRLHDQVWGENPEFQLHLLEVADAILEKVAPEPFRRADPEWKLSCWQQLRAARNAGLLTA